MVGSKKKISASYFRLRVQDNFMWLWYFPFMVGVITQIIVRGIENLLVYLLIFIGLYSLGLILFTMYLMGIGMDD